MKDSERVGLLSITESLAHSTPYSYNAVILLTDKFGALAASKFTFDFEEMEGYLIFKVNIPKLPSEGCDYIRVGTICRKK